jgi:two-component system chemotaxis response regulator CheY
LARKILLADDSVTAQNMGRKILADAGYEVITVNNGSAALKKIAELKPEIIILDVYMPGYSGLEVCQRLKEAQETSRIPVLLTVGKLEPFKPEEAKRVRAEGYIVKPFEASELLSALSKLEDKIVPRAEASKPGRFARANAALDEGRYDKSVAIDEDSGWKNRIGFPSKKKKVEQEEGDDSSIYNAVNKDLRTVMDRPPVAQANEARGEESRVDLGALAPEGLPKDVTPEEIAALAAAAAQVKGKLAEPVAENLPELPAEILLGAKVADVPSAELKAEAKTEPAPVAELPKESEKPTATFAAQKPEDAASAKPADAGKESDVPEPSPAEMMAAIAGLVPEVDKPTDSHSGNGSRPYAASEEQGKKEQSADEPVTMAAAAGAVSAGMASRWTAVAVSLAPEESSVSLEHEMQKAHAAFAAAEAVPVVVAPTPEVVPAAVESVAAPQVSSPVEAVAELGAPAVAEPQRRDEVAPKEIAQADVAQSFSPVSSPSPEVVAAAVREFERVAASFEARPHAADPVQAEHESASALAVEQVSQPAQDTRAFVESVPEPGVAAALPEHTSAPAEPASEFSKESTPFTAMEERKVEEAKYDEPKYDGPKQEEVKQQEAKPEEAKQEVAQQEEVPEVAAVAALVEELSAPASEKLESASPAAEKEESAEAISASPATAHATEPVAATEPAAESIKDVAKDAVNKESEITETTAAAWASWRRIRESGDGKGSAHSEKHAASKDEKGSPQDSSARAVAAGAEKSPEDPAASSEESPEIASIVDSVLAGMRPKIVEEISRKLGKK